MIATRAATRGSVASKQTTAQLLKSFHGYNAGLRPSIITVQHIQLARAGQRNLSSSPGSLNPKTKVFFEEHPTNKVRKTPSAWPHPGTPLSTFLDLNTH